MSERKTLPTGAAEERFVRSTTEIRSAAGCRKNFSTQMRMAGGLSRRAILSGALRGVLARALPSRTLSNGADRSIRRWSRD